MPENKQERRRTVSPAVEAESTIDHCRRVTAWCRELAGALWLPQYETAALCDAALMHHHADLMPDDALRRLLADIGLADGEGDLRGRYTGRLSDRVLDAYLNPAGTHDERSRALAALLEHANSCDEEAEFAALHGECAGGANSRERSVAFVEAALRRAGREELQQAMARCPEFPEPARKVWKAVQGGVLSGESLASIAESDPELAPAVNIVAETFTQSGSFHSASAEEKQRLILACSLRPLYETSQQPELWQHALEAAQIAEQLARASGAVDPAQAFFAGLLHDAGKAVYSLVSSDLNGCRLRLVLAGCHGRAVENVVAGFDHAEAGAELLARWQLDRDLIEGVRWHHQPEVAGTALAAILYLTEYWTDPDEDLPPGSRLSRALLLAGLRESAFDNLTPPFGAAATA